MGRALAAIAMLAIVVSLGVRASAAGDIVLIAADFAQIHGNWTKTASSSAAGGQMLASSDWGWSTVSSPLAAPADYVEATFSAPSYTPYHVWVRLRATNNSKYNDSVWMQLSDALDLNGSRVFSIGSTSGLLMNLENCSGCGVSSWGWQDGAYWLQQTTIIQFSSSGTHTVRLQTREDGVQFDQVVFSPATYLGSAPGSVTNDSTILSATATTVSGTSGGSTSSSSSAYSGSAALIPGLIQAEQFDNGGEGVAYHDTTSGNSGGSFRQTDVDIEPSPSGYDVGWVAAGEWLKYSVNVASTGKYLTEFRVASQGSGGTFHLEMNGANVTGTMTVPDTGGWQNWQTLTTTVSLTAGVQSARLVMDGGGSIAVGNFDWMQFTPTTTSTVTTGGSAPASPSSPNPPSGTVGVTVTPNLSWTAAGATSYDVRLGTSNPPSTVVSNSPNYWYGPSALNGGTTYYWQIVAKNSSGSTTGPVWSFTTAGSSSTSTSSSSGSTSSGSGAGIAVATWNIQVNDSSAAHARTAIDQLVALSPQPQAIVIEEAYKSLYSTYINELQNRTGLTWSGAFQTHCPPGAWNGSSCTSTEDEGVGVFSSLPISGSSTTLLPYADAYHSARAAVRVAVSVGGTTVQVFGVHLPTSRTPRDSAMAAFRNWASNYSTPQLVGGDFNADPDQIDISSGMGGAFVDSWSVVGSGLGYTAFNPNPTMKLDYWFADSGGRAQPLWTYVITSTGSISDHLPVVAYFSVR